MVTSLSKYADELVAIAAQDHEPVEVRRRLRAIADRMRRDASVKPNAKPFAVYGEPPISGGREVRVERQRYAGMPGKKPPAPSVTVRPRG